MMRPGHYPGAIQQKALVLCCSGPKERTLVVYRPKHPKATVLYSPEYTEESRVIPDLGSGCYYFARYVPKSGLEMSKWRRIL